MEFDILQSVFAIELMIAALMYTWGYEKKPKFMWKVIFGIFCLCLVASISFGSFYTNEVLLGSRTIYYIMVFVMLILVLWLSFEITFIEACAICLLSYAAQHAAYDVFMLTVTILHIDLATIIFTSVHWVIEMLVYGGVYLLLYFMFARQLQLNPEFLQKRKRWLVIFAGNMAFMIVLNLLKGEGSLSVRQTLAFHIYDLVGTILGMLILFYMSITTTMKADIQEMERVLKLKEEYYEMSKENIELVNIRCHDISQRLEQLSDIGVSPVAQEAIKQVQDDIHMYDSIVKTGNEALDVVLAEKKLYCEKQHIRLTCMADGGKLDFIEPIDIYFVFGNIIQNAIEAVEKIEDKSKRIISLEVTTKENFVIIQSENYYETELIMNKNIPLTTKKEKEMHGMGMKSIRMVVDKYHGEMTISGADEIFALNVLIPFP